MKSEFVVKRLSYAERLGWAVSILSASGRYDGLPIASISAWLIPNIKLRQVEIVFDGNELPAGYISWAYLTPDLERRWLSDSPGVWHLSEFKEGESLWIIDFIALPGQMKVCLEAAKGILPAHESIRFCKARNDDLGRIVTTWTRRRDGRFSRVHCLPDQADVGRASADLRQSEPA